jgi:hypothetical protein
VKKLKNTPMVILAFLIVLWGLDKGVTFFIEDWMANVEIVRMSPAVKFNAEIYADIAQFIQLAPMLFGWLFSMYADQRSWHRLVYGGATLLFLTADWLIGVMFRTNLFSLDPVWTMYVALEDAVFFTFGSELLLTALIPTAWNLLVPTMTQTARMVAELFNGIVAVLNILFGGFRRRNHPRYPRPSGNYQPAQQPKRK